MIDIRYRIPSGHSGRFTIPNLDEVEGIAVHHSVSGWVWQPETRKYTCHWNDAVDVAQEVEVAHLLAIDRWHSLPNNDWGGFGYHIAAFASGRWYYVGSLNTARAHVVGLNKRFIGLVLIGDFTSAVPCESQLAAAKEGVASICDFYGRMLSTEAHRNIRFQNTTCPGDTWEEWGPKLKEEPMPEFTKEQEKRIKEIVSWCGPGLEMQARLSVSRALRDTEASVMTGGWNALPDHLIIIKELAQRWHRWKE